MWKFLRGAESQNGNYEEGVRIESEISKSQIVQYQSDDGGVGKQTSRGNIDFIGQTRIKIQRSRSSAQEEGKRVAVETIALDKIVVLDLWRVEEKI